MDLHYILLPKWQFLGGTLGVVRENTPILFEVEKDSHF